MPGQILRACAGCAQGFKPRHARQRYCDKPGCQAKAPAPSPTTHNGPPNAERERIKAAVLARDPLCTIQLPGCTGRSEVPHHVVDAADGGAFTLDNLAGACHHCNSALGGRRAHQSAHAAQARDGGAAALNVGGSADQPPLYQRLR